MSAVYHDFRIVTLSSPPPPSKCGHFQSEQDSRSATTALRVLKTTPCCQRRRHAKVRPIFMQPIRVKCCPGSKRANGQHLTLIFGQFCATFRPFFSKIAPTVLLYPTVPESHNVCKLGRFHHRFGARIEGGRCAGFGQFQLPKMRAKHCSTSKRANGQHLALILGHFCATLGPFYAPEFPISQTRLAGATAAP